MLAELEVVDPAVTEGVLIDVAVKVVTSTAVVLKYHLDAGRAYTHTVYTVSAESLVIDIEITDPVSPAATVVVVV